MPVTPSGPVESGYVAHLLLNGTYDSIPSLLPPEANDGTREILAVLNGGIGQLWARSLNGRRWPPKSRMDGVFDGLRKHSWETDLHLDANRNDIEAVLSPLYDRADEILAQAANHKEDSNFSGLPRNMGHEDALVLAAARWFKHEYFRWVDPIACAWCEGKTAAAGMGELSAEDRAGGAGRVEIHKCTSCGDVTRFPRYNDTKALMRARVGRCGEFAQLFYIFLLALGLEARYVWNSEDHVWTEYWSPSLCHWVHVDSCEAEVNKPLLYDRGWGKMQSYCLAFGAGGAEDVTRVYVDDWEACLRRRAEKKAQGSGWGEEKLKWMVMQHTVQCRGFLDDEERLRLQSMDEAQARWVDDKVSRWKEAEAGGLKGRQSGTDEWKEARGEAGKDDKTEEDEDERYL